MSLYFYKCLTCGETIFSKKDLGEEPIIRFCRYCNQDRELRQDLIPSYIEIHDSLNPSVNYDKLEEKIKNYIEE